MSYPVHDEAAGAPAPADAALATEVVWQVNTHVSMIEVRATSVECDDDLLVFYHDATRGTPRDDGIVAVVPTTMVAWAGDNRYVTLIDPPVRIGEGDGADA